MVHKLSPSYLQKLVYGAMPLEPAETRPRFNSILTKLDTNETILMAGTEYFGETAVQPRDYIPVNTMRKPHNHTHSRH